MPKPKQPREMPRFSHNQTDKIDASPRAPTPRVFDDYDLLNWLEIEVVGRLDRLHLKLDKLQLRPHDLVEFTPLTQSPRSPKLRPPPPSSLAPRKYGHSVDSQNSIEKQHVGNGSSKIDAKVDTSVEQQEKVPTNNGELKPPPTSSVDTHAPHKQSANSCTSDLQPVTSASAFLDIGNDLFGDEESEGSGVHSHFGDTRCDRWSRYITVKPSAPTSYAWSLGVAIAVLYICWLVPFVLGFPWWRKESSLGTFDQLIEIFFWLDMLQSFRTGYDHDGHVVMDLKSIAKHYLRFWFWVDLVANVPWETVAHFLITDKAQRKSIKAIKWLKLSKLVRVARWRKIINMQAGGKGHYVHLALRLVTILFMLHGCACSWINLLGTCEAYPPNGYVWQYAHEVIDSIVLEDPQLGWRCTQSTVLPFYGEALHVGASLVVGQSRGALTQIFDRQSDGDSDNKTYGGLFYVMAIWQLLGILMVGNLLAHLTKIVFMQNLREVRFQLEYDSAQRELEQYARHIPSELRQRIRVRFRESFKRLDYGPLTLLGPNLLNLNMRAEVAVALYQDTVVQVPAIEKANFGVLSSFCIALQPETYTRSEYIYLVGQRPTGIMFLRSGIVHVGQSPDQVWTVPRRGVFGATALLMQFDGERTSSKGMGIYVHQDFATSVTDSQVLAMPKDDLRTFFQLSPDLFVDLKRLNNRRRTTSSRTSIELFNSINGA